MGKHVAIAIFFGIVAAMTTGGISSGLHVHGTDAVLAITFVVVFVVTLGVQRVRASRA